MPRGASTTTTYLGDVERVGREHPRRAREIARAVEQGARSAGDRVGMVRALALAGKMAIALGDLDDACSTAARMEPIAIDIDHPCATVAALTFQAQLAFFMGAYRDALTNATRAIAIADGTGERELRAAVRRGTCLVLGNLNAPMLGAVIHERRDLCDERDAWDRGIIHNDFAQFAIDAGDLARATDELVRAARVARSVEEDSSVALKTALDGTWAQLRMAEGKPDEALVHIRSAKRRLAATELPHPYLIGMTTLVGMQIHVEHGSFEQAEAEARYGLLRMQEYLPMVRSAILSELAEILRELNRVDEAYQALHESMELDRAASRQFVALQHDLNQAVSEHAAARNEVETLREIAGRDWLTGLLNRRFLATLSFVGVGTVGVAAIDLDDFKSINDTFGHAAGDRVLARVASLLEASAREGDPVVRLGGDEFVVVMPGVDDLVADSCARRLRDTLVREDWDALIPGMRFGASIGYAVGLDTDDVETILAVADRRLYRAKSAGRGRVIGNDIDRS